MLRILKFLWTGKWWYCKHDWEIIKQGTIESASTSTLTGVVYVLQCKHCGEIKFVEHDVN